MVLLPAEQVPSYASLAAAEPALGKQFKADFEDDAKQLGLLAHAPPAKAVAPPRTEVVNYL